MDMPLNVIVKSFRQNPEGFEVTEPRNLGSSKYSVIGVTDKDTETNLHPYQNVTYFVINRDTRRAAVIDPGIIGGVGVEKQRGYLAMSKLGIEQALYGVITHCHIDHWIGFKSFNDILFYATQVCIDALTHDGEPVQFSKGTLAPSHSKELPPRIIEYANSLKWDHQLTNYKNMLRKHQEEIPMELFALPGQTRDSSYAVMESDGEKYLFAGDLFLDGGKNGLMIEPHYSQVDKLRVVQDTLLVLNGILGGWKRGSSKPTSYV